MKFTDTEVTLIHKPQKVVKGVVNTGRFPIEVTLVFNGDKYEISALTRVNGTPPLEGTVMRSLRFVDMKINLMRQGEFELSDGTILTTAKRPDSAPLDKVARKVWMQNVAKAIAQIAYWYDAPNLRTISEYLGVNQRMAARLSGSEK